MLLLSLNAPQSSRRTTHVCQPTVAWKMTHKRSLSLGGGINILTVYEAPKLPLMKINNDNRTVLCPTQGKLQSQRGCWNQVHRSQQAAAVAETNVFTYRQRGVTWIGNKTECLRRNTPAGPKTMLVLSRVSLSFKKNLTDFLMQLLRGPGGSFFVIMKDPTKTDTHTCTRTHTCWN